MRYLTLLFALMLAVSACSGGDDSEPAESGSVPATETPLSTSINSSSPTPSGPAAPVPGSTETPSPTATVSPTPSPQPTRTPTPEPATGPNLLTNSDFEDGTTGATGWSLWQDLEPGQTVEFTSEDAFSGERSLKITSPGSASLWPGIVADERLVIDPDASYWLTAYVKTEEGAVFWSGWRYLEDETDIRHVAAGASGQVDVTETEWTRLRTLVIPRGNVPFLLFDLQLALVPELVGLNPDDEMVLYIDDVSLRKQLDQ